MPNYRTDSLFHYTSTADTIVNILSSGLLIPNYCLEELDTDEHPEFKLGVPQICFCDIPLSRSQLFLDQYGKYAIAFKKEWGVSQGCNPIHYVSNPKIIDAAATRYLAFRKKTQQLTAQIALGGITNVIREYIEWNKNLQENNYALGFIKKYMGTWKGRPYCNYDENEWRYIIEETVDTPWMYSADDYFEWRGDKRRHKPEPTEKLKNRGLIFSPMDINHIIVHKDSHIPNMVKAISKITHFGGSRLTSDMKNLLISKINSFERIDKDY